MITELLRFITFTLQKTEHSFINHLILILLICHSWHSVFPALFSLLNLKNIAKERERENYIMSGKVRVGKHQGSRHMTIDNI